MRSKAPLAMMEQLVMVLVFALAAALCLQVFVLSDRMSEQAAQRDRAVILAQNTAELLKHSGGDFEQAAQMLDGTWDGTRLTVGSDGLQMTAVRLVSGQTLLGMAQITVCAPDGEEPLFQLTAAWQEVDGNE